MGIGYESGRGPVKFRHIKGSRSFVWIFREKGRTSPCVYEPKIDALLQAGYLPACRLGDLLCDRHYKPSLSPVCSFVPAVTTSSATMFPPTTAAFRKL